MDIMGSYKETIHDWNLYTNDGECMFIFLRNKIVESYFKCKFNLIICSNEFKTPHCLFVGKS
jgi:hypothetical protein